MFREEKVELFVQFSPHCTNTFSVSGNFIRAQLSMKISRYLSIRISILIVGFLLIWNLSYYTLPRYIREDGFGFVAELDRIFSFNLYFSILFFLFSSTEVYKFNKQNQTLLQKEAIVLSVFSLIIIIISIYLYHIYS